MKIKSLVLALSIIPALSLAKTNDVHLYGKVGPIFTLTFQLFNLEH
ncbi:Uncharacterised protein [[Haemophilus] ducreyi]|nr:Uncharacterised protein [[Haemophilus] ducreyi]